MTHYSSKDLLLHLGTISANLFTVFKYRKIYLICSSVLASPAWIVIGSNNHKTSSGTAAQSP